MTTEHFIQLNKRKAIHEAVRSKIPASITMAQAILESDSGNSSLSKRSNNLFGIKCHHNWYGEHVLANDDAIGECFRKYRTTLGSFKDHSKFLQEEKRYRHLFSLSKNDYHSWALGLKKAGYATNPNYANILISLIEKYDLHKLDKKTTIVKVSRIAAWVIVSILLLLLITYFIKNYKNG